MERSFKDMERTMDNVNRRMRNLFWAVSFVVLFVVKRRE